MWKVFVLLIKSYLDREGRGAYIKDLPRQKVE